MAFENDVALQVGWPLANDFNPVIALGKLLLLVNAIRVRVWWRMCSYVSSAADLLTVKARRQEPQGEAQYFPTRPAL